MPKTRLLYSPEFRHQMVDLVHAGRAPEDLAKEFEPTAQSIYHWVAVADRQEGRREEKADNLSCAERDELARLRRENKQLRLERDILSRASAWFARETEIVLAGRLPRLKSRLCGSPHHDHRGQLACLRAPAPNVTGLT